MNSLETLREKYTAFNSLNMNAAQQMQLMPLFNHILKGLEDHSGKLAKTAMQFADLKDSVCEERTTKILTESRTEAMASAHTELESVIRRLEVCGTALATAAQGEVVSSDIAKNTQKLSDIEIRQDLKEMSEAERINVLFETASKGSNEVLGVIQRAPITKKLVPAEILERATGDYLNKIVPRQVAEFSLMEDVTEKATAAVSLADISMGHLEQGQTAGRNLSGVAI